MPEKLVLPNWMFEQLEVEPGDSVDVSLLCCPSIPVAKALTLKPSNSCFNIASVDTETREQILENSLRRYSAVKVSDTIQIEYNGIYEMTIIKAEPGNMSVDITECDVEITFDFEVYEKRDEIDRPGYYEENLRKDSEERGIPDYNWEIGTLHFARSNQEDPHNRSTPQMDCNNDDTNIENVRNEDIQVEDDIDVLELRKQRLAYFGI